MKYVLVFAGGVVGTAARYGLAEATRVTTWPWATFTVNVVGSLLLGLLVALVTEPLDGRRLLLGTGAMGGFTTYSAFAVETDQLLRSGDAALGLVYAIVSVTLGIAAAVVGLALGRRKAA